MSDGTGVVAHAAACGARNRAGGTCGHPAGYGTPHPGEGRCKFHGGLNPVRHGRYSTIKRAEIRELIEHHEGDPDPLNLLPELATARALFQDFIDRYDEWREALIAWHRTYTAAERPLAEDRLLAAETVCDELEALVGPADLDEEEVEQEGARVRRAIRDARKLVAELRAPAESGKPRRILDLSDAVGHAEAISRIVKRIEDVRAQNAISRPELMRIMQEMGRVVARYVDDPGTREKIQDAWLSIRA
jgi:hypothetical protein